MKPLVVSGSNYKSEARKLAEYLDAEFIDTMHKIFPDGETYIRILEPDKIRDRNVIVTNTLYPNQNSSIIETLLLIDAVRRKEAKKIVLFLPYLAYVRQDKVFLDGEPVSIKVVLEALRVAGSQSLVTIDMHNPQALGFFEGVTRNLLVIDELFENVIDKVTEPVVLAPDKGALHRASYLAEKYGLSYGFLEKRRDRVTGEVSYETSSIDVLGRDVIIVDDVISTGGTIATSTSLLLKRGARNVYVLATHGLFVDNAIEKLKVAGVRKVFVANTVGYRVRDELVEYVDVLESVSQILKEITL